MNMDAIIKTAVDRGYDDMTLQQSLTTKSFILVSEKHRVWVSAESIDLIIGIVSTLPLISCSTTRRQHR